MRWVGSSLQKGEILLERRMAGELRNEGEKTGVVNVSMSQIERSGSAL